MGPEENNTSIVTIVGTSGCNKSGFAIRKVPAGLGDIDGPQEVVKQLVMKLRLPESTCAWTDCEPANVWVGLYDSWADCKLTNRWAPKKFFECTYDELKAAVESGSPAPKGDNTHYRNYSIGPMTTKEADSATTPDTSSTTGSTMTVVESADSA